MYTKVWIVDKLSTETKNCPQMTQPANLLREGEVVAFPTETVYGLGANALDGVAVQKIYKAKGRPSDNPLIVHISNREMLNQLVRDVPIHAQTLMDKFWPGPLTIILKKQAHIPDEVTAGLDTVAIRYPAHPIAQLLIEQSGVPIAAPSANRSGRPSPTMVSHVIQDLHGRISGIIDGGIASVGVESTVIDCTLEVPFILRPGGITKEQIESALQLEVLCQKNNEELQVPKAPGMKYRHYAPRAPLHIVKPSSRILQPQIDAARSKGLKVGVMTTSELAGEIKADVIHALGNDLNSVAAGLFEALRRFDDQQVDLIFATDYAEHGIGQAIMNRLYKASKG